MKQFWYVGQGGGDGDGHGAGGGHGDDDDDGYGDDGQATNHRSHSQTWQNHRYTLLMFCNPGSSWLRPMICEFLAT